MILRKAIEDYRARIAPRTEAKLQHQINRWMRYDLPKRASKITTADFDRFRKLATEDGLSPATIEDTVSDILTLLRYVLDRDRVPLAGHRLRRRVQTKHVPDVDEVAAAYEAAGCATWPNNPRTRNKDLLDIDNESFWRAWIVLGYWTGLRLGDMCRIEWSWFADKRLKVKASKTSKEHEFPVPEIVAIHLEPLRRAGLSRPFPVAKWAHGRIRRELGRMHSDFGPQPLRRAAITTWACASPEAGRIVHGERLGVLRHYYDTCRILSEAAPRFRWPTSIMEGAGLTEQTQRRAELLAALQRVPDHKISDVLNVTRALSAS